MSTPRVGAILSIPRIWLPRGQIIPATFLLSGMTSVPARPDIRAISAILRRPREWRAFRRRSVSRVLRVLSNESGAALESVFRSVFSPIRGGRGFHCSFTAGSESRAFLSGAFHCRFTANSDSVPRPHGVIRGVLDRGAPRRPHGPFSPREGHPLPRPCRPPQGATAASGGMFRRVDWQPSPVGPHRPTREGHPSGSPWENPSRASRNVNRSPGLGGGAYPARQGIEAGWAEVHPRPSRLRVTGPSRGRSPGPDRQNHAVPIEAFPTTITGHSHNAHRQSPFPFLSVLNGYRRPPPGPPWAGRHRVYRVTSFLTGSCYRNARAGSPHRASPPKCYRTRHHQALSILAPRRAPSADIPGRSRPSVRGDLASGGQGALLILC